MVFSVSLIFLIQKIIVCDLKQLHVIYLMAKKDVSFCSWRGDRAKNDGTVLDDPNHVSLKNSGTPRGES